MTNFKLNLIILISIAFICSSNSCKKKEPTSQWTPAECKLPSKWFNEVDPNLPLPEYPRPQFKRKEWMNLNGLWDYTIVDKKTENVDSTDGKILVPYPIESALSGVGKRVTSDQKIILLTGILTGLDHHQSLMNLNLTKLLIITD